ncbi:abl interactor 1-like [Amblyraja radiata]|uniref:abl interactor 1-like n=1 Tax=Amblyraja radiata TaxID=386614 RepID=UPI001403B477|nr:abl interactor 1-like [Amblyraja radiata]
MKQSGCKMAEIQKLLQQDIPADRQVLVENYTKLQQVAEHCENNYVQAQDKTKALQETKAYTTQSLAGVVYQINTLAEKVLRLLDLQASEISKMESSINCISQRVEMHKEKVARREIGAFTVIKTTPKITKIIPPTNPILRVKYTRKPIIYTVLDDVGHGVKESSNNSRLGTLTRRNRQGSIPTCPTVPSQGTIGRRGISPAPVQPPVVPSALSSPVTSSPPADGPQVLSSEPGRDRSSSRASDMVVPPPPPPPPPTPATCETDGIGFPEPLAVNSLGLPPAPPPPPEVTSEIYLPPPPPLMSDAPSSVTECPPPPPPPDYMLDFDECPPPPPPIDYLDDHHLAPANYIEKVVALFAYNKNCEEDLTFKEGEIIYVIKKNENGWYEGIINGITGYFPENYVQPID